MVRTLSFVTATTILSGILSSSVSADVPSTSSTTKSSQIVKVETPNLSAEQEAKIKVILDKAEDRRLTPEETKEIVSLGRNQAEKEFLEKSIEARNSLTEWLVKRKPAQQHIIAKFSHNMMMDDILKNAEKAQQKQKRSDPLSDAIRRDIWEKTRENDAKLDDIREKIDAENAQEVAEKKVEAESKGALWGALEKISEYFSDHYSPSESSDKTADPDSNEKRDTTDLLGEKLDR